MEQVLPGVVSTSGRRRMWERGWEGANTVYTLYVNGKMIPVETIPGIGGEGNKEEWFRE
jgi:hypothetical protein